jgi:peptidoglycan/LPS O-acetylase OafA/YrhL
MFFLAGYLSYQIHLKLKEKPVSNQISLFALIFIIAFTILYNYLPSIRVHWFPFSIKELIYFSTIILSIPLLFNWLKDSRIDYKIGELSYPVYISHMLVFFICTLIGNKTLPFIFKEGWFISLATIIVAYFLNKIIASPIEKYRQSRLKNNASR